MTFMTDDEAFNRWFNDTNARRPRSYKETFLAGVEYGRKTATPQPCPVCHGKAGHGIRDGRRSPGWYLLLLPRNRTENLMRALWKLRPEVLLCPNVPKPMHGLAPRVVLGSAWWDETRQRAYRSTNYHCIACGVSRERAKYHQWMEGHELYSINYPLDEWCISKPSPSVIRAISISTTGGSAGYSTRVKLPSLAMDRSSAMGIVSSRPLVLGGQPMPSETEF